MSEDQKRSPELIGSFCGFPVYINHDVAPGWIQLRDKDGRIIGADRIICDAISDVGEIHVSYQRSP